MGSRRLCTPLFRFRAKASNGRDDRGKQHDPEADAEEDQKQSTHIASRADERSRRTEYVGAPAPPRGSRTRAMSGARSLAFVDPPAIELTH